MTARKTTGATYVVYDEDGDEVRITKTLPAPGERFNVVAAPGQEPTAHAVTLDEETVSRDAAG